VDAGALSALLALNLAYVIWYMGVQRLGPARTSIYSNGVPIVAMAVATVWLGEPLTGTKVAGAAAVLSGVLLTRLGRRLA
jgi:drug/metabolite transporter (DMT)-like permease